MNLTQKKAESSSESHYWESSGRRESERKAAATAGHMEKEDGTRVKRSKLSGPAHTEGDINNVLLHL
jgi:hypothetical protein